MTHQKLENFGAREPRFVVCTSSTRPGNPRVGDRIYETDTGNDLTWQSATTGWTPPWNTKWGDQAGHGVTTWTTDTTFTTVETDITNATLSWTAIANRFYEVTLSMHYFASIVNDQSQISITDGSNVHKWQVAPLNLSATTAQPFTLRYVESGIAAGSPTRKVRGIRIGGTGTQHAYADATFVGTLSIMDVGPNGAPV